MKIDLLEPSNIALIEAGMLTTLRKIYTGENLWAEIDSVDMDYTIIEEINPNPNINIKIRYGRQDIEGEGNGFCKDCMLYDNERIEDLQFFLGRFYECVLNNEEK